MIDFAKAITILSKDPHKRKTLIMLWQSDQISYNAFKNIAEHFNLKISTAPKHITFVQDIHNILTTIQTK